MTIEEMTRDRHKLQQEIDALLYGFTSKYKCKELDFSLDTTTSITGDICVNVNIITNL